MAKTFSGATEQAVAPIVGQDFWKKGTKIEGVITNVFETSNGICYTVRLRNPKTVELDPDRTGKKESFDQISVGASAGLVMALRAAGVPGAELLENDAIIFECTGKTPTGKGNDRTNFKVAVVRP